MGTLLIAAGVEAQDLNIDLGTAIAAPMDTQGGAASQPGVWNDLGVGSFPLVGLDGMPTAATVDVVATNASGNAPPILGDDELIGDDFILGTNGAGWSLDFSNLVDGAYEVYVMRGDNPSVTTGAMEVGGVAVASLDTANGTSPYSFILDESYSVVEVDVTGGSLLITGEGAGFTGLAAVQLATVTVPEPSAVLSTAAGALVLLAVRRPRRSRRPIGA
jgi:hypothetical protein